jgi:hypothetical protein
MMATTKKGHKMQIQFNSVNDAGVTFLFDSDSTSRWNVTESTPALLSRNAFHAIQHASWKAFDSRRSLAVDWCGSFAHYLLTDLTNLFPWEVKQGCFPQLIDDATIAFLASIKYGRKYFSMELRDVSNRESLCHDRRWFPIGEAFNQLTVTERIIYLAQQSTDHAQSWARYTVLERLGVVHKIGEHLQRIDQYEGHSSFNTIPKWASKDLFQASRHLFEAIHALDHMRTLRELIGNRVQRLTIAEAV